MVVVEPEGKRALCFGCNKNPVKALKEAYLKFKEIK